MNELFNRTPQVRAFGNARACGVRLNNRPNISFRAANGIVEERPRIVDKVRIHFDREGNTLSIWFDDPLKEAVCQETDDDVILVKDRRGRVIGFERLNFLNAKQRADAIQIPVEVQLA